ncbi:MAG: hypothetical protein P4L50_01945 [Anaerolineaceae bacterium]|nr:hypothetical protein [Anaerolineaceae bacterium]
MSFDAVDILPDRILFPVARPLRHKFIVFIDELCDTADISGRIPGINAVCRYIFGNGTVGANDDIITYRDIRKHDTFRADEHVAADSNPAYFRITQIKAGTGVMGQDMNPGSHRHIVTDTYQPAMRWIENYPMESPEIMADLQTAADKLFGGVVTPQAIYKGF